MMTQRTWRTIGAVTLVLCLLMGIYGRFLDVRDGPFFYAAYWAVFIVFMVITLWMAAIDVKYILLQYRAGHREIFQDTLGDEQFRKAMRDALDEVEREKKQGK